MAGQILVAREKELEQLKYYLGRALNQQGQMCFVVGEAGSGKSALTYEFAQIAQGQHEGLLVAVGSCNAQTGIGDPYLPFREVLSLLTGDVKSHLTQGIITSENANRLRKFVRTSGEALVELGPDLIGIFVPAAGLAARAATFAAGKAGWLSKLEGLRKRKSTSTDELEQHHILEQYTRVLQRMAAQQPLMLMLDDLQWADAASIGLLFHLSRRIEGHRIVVIGTYRPDDVALGRAGERHPLESVVNEIKRYCGEVIIDLGVTTAERGRQFVNTFLDTEPNKLSRTFRRQLFRRTGGNPLFTIELLRNMQERGDIVRDEQGFWIESRTLEWDELPARVEGVIEERFSRLEAKLRELLGVAAVEGDNFTAQVMASVQGLSDREILYCLYRQLQTKQGLVVESGVEKLNRQIIFLYSFRHSLFQKYIYDQLSVAERILLHQAVGEALEKLYDRQVTSIAPRLARHFSEAKQDSKALGYLVQAGDSAYSAYAYVEAVIHYSRALEIAENIGINVDDFAHIYSRRGRALELAGKYDEALSNYDEMIAQAKERGVRSLELSALISSATVYCTPTARHDPVQGQVLCAKALALAQELRNPEAMAEVLWNLMLLNSFTGYPLKAVKFGQESLAISHKLKDKRMVAFCLNDISYPYVAVGQLDQGIAALAQARQLWREIGNAPMLVDNLARSATVHFIAGNYDEAIKFSEQASLISKKIGSLWGQSFSQKNVCYIHLDRGNIEKAIESMKEAINIAEQAGNVDVLVGTRADLGWVYATLGAVECGLELCHVACAKGRELLPGWLPWALASLGRLYVIKGDLGRADALIKEAGKRTTSKDPTTSLTPIVVALSTGELAIAKRDYESAITAMDDLVTDLRQVGMSPFVPDALYYKGKSLRALGQADQAFEVLALARSESESLGACRTLWPILMELSYVEQQRGNRKEARAFKSHARRIVGYIADHIGDPELRAAFLGLPEVHATIKS